MAGSKWGKTWGLRRGGIKNLGIINGVAGKSEIKKKNYF